MANLEAVARDGAASAERFIAGLQTMKLALQAAAARASQRPATITFSENGRPTGRVVLPHLDWDTFDAAMLAEWRRQEKAFAANPRAGIFFARHDDPRLL